MVVLVRGRSAVALHFSELSKLKRGSGVEGLRNYEELALNGGA